MFHIILSSLSDVWGGRGNPEKTTKSCWREHGLSCRILIILPCVHFCTATHPATLQKKRKIKYGLKDGLVPVATNRKPLPRKQDNMFVTHLSSSQHWREIWDFCVCKHKFNLVCLMLSQLKADKEDVVYSNTAFSTGWLSVTLSNYQDNVEGWDGSSR